MARSHRLAKGLLIAGLNQPLLENAHALSDRQPDAGTAIDSTCEDRLRPIEAAPYVEHFLNVHTFPRSLLYFVVISLIRVVRIIRLRSSDQCSLIVDLDGASDTFRHSLLLGFIFQP
jgi:hypothetical protein